MPKYARYNPMFSISPITHWYDTDRFSYVDLPPQSELFPLTEAEWARRFFGTYGIEDGELVQLSS